MLEKLLISLGNLNDSFTAQGVDMSVRHFIVNLLLAGVLSYLLQVVYERCGRSLSNRKEFGGNFVLVSMTTMIIISIVKSSLALSLGLVGALSIVRFRTAVKEPEELAYLFLAVAIGVGCGAFQAVITTIGFVIMVLVLWLKSGLWREPSSLTHLNLLVSASGPDKTDFSTIKGIVEEHANVTLLQRLDDSKDATEVAFAVGFENAGRLEACGQALRALGEGVRVSYVSPKRIGV